MDDTPILYSFRRCPYAMRARMAIAVSKTPVQLREVILKDKPEEMTQASSKGTVPVLLVGDKVLDESLDVMHWALEHSDPENWLSAKDPELVEQADGPFKYHLDRYKYATRYEDADPETHRAEGLDFLNTINARLADAPYLHGDSRGFTDIATFPFVRQFRIADPEWFDSAPLPNVQKWLVTLTNAGLFLSVMKKYSPWKETGEEYAFPAK